MADSRDPRDVIDVLDAAWSYADQGFHLLPLIGKVPSRDLLPHICGQATFKPYLERRNTPQEIRYWFRRPGINIGTLTVVSGVVFVDCDTSEDAEWWAHNYPPTSIVTKTARGVQFGYQVYPASRTIRNRSGLFRRKIDFRGYVGYVVLPPSQHPSGIQYEKIGTWQLIDAPQFDPAWIECRVERSPGSGRRSQFRTSRQLETYIRCIESVAGKRGHDACFRCACRIAETGMYFDDAMQLFRSWNQRCAFPPWSEAELLHKMTDAFRNVLGR